jgi:hypothetical protein
LKNLKNCFSLAGERDEGTPCRRLYGQTLSSETIAVLPVNRARLTLGIGEQFSVKINKFNKFNKFCGGVIAWSVDNTIDPAHRSDVQIKSFSADNKDIGLSAGFFPGTCRVRATFSATTGKCATCPAFIELTFIIIEPTGVSFVRAPDAEQFCPGPLDGHVENMPSIRFKADVAILPDYVNFYKIKTREGPCPIQLNGPYITGYPEFLNPHADGGWVFCINAVVGGRGTLASFDDIKYYFKCDRDYSSNLAGDVTFQIPYYFQRLNPVSGVYESIQFCTITQMAVLSGGANATITASKGLLSRLTHLLDLNNCTAIVCPP